MRGREDIWWKPQNCVVPWQLGAHSREQCSRTGQKKCCKDDCVLGVGILKGTLIYKISKVWQLKEEDGRRKDTNECLHFGGVPTTGSSYLMLLTHVQALTGPVIFHKAFEEMINELCSFCLVCTSKFFPHWPGLSSDQKGIEEGERRLGRLLEKESKEREYSNHLLAFFEGLCSIALASQACLMPWEKIVPIPLPFSWAVSLPGQLDSRVFHKVLQEQEVG